MASKYTPVRAVHLKRVADDINDNIASVELANFDMFGQLTEAARTGQLSCGFSRLELSGNAVRFLESLGYVVERKTSGGAFWTVVSFNVK